jgi:hypothetical protein
MGKERGKKGERDGRGREMDVKETGEGHDRDS